MLTFNPRELDSDELVEIITSASRELARRAGTTPVGEQTTDNQPTKHVLGEFEPILKQFEQARRLVDEERLLVQLRKVDAELRCIERTEGAVTLAGVVESALICLEDLEDLKKRVPLISTADDWNAAMGSLQNLRDELDGFAIVSLIDRLIDKLKSHWPSVAPERQVFDPKRGQALERATHHRCKNDKPMVLRTSRNRGTLFWGCSEFPACGCYSRRWLTKDESNYIFGESDSLPS